MTKSKPSVGIIGAGRLGSTLAKALLGAGYSVTIASSRPPESMDLMMSVLLPGAVPAAAADTARQNEVIILAIPLHQYKSLDPALFQGKILIDATNYWPATEGHIADFEQSDIGSSEVLQSYFAGAQLVKTLNHVAYGELYEHAQPAGHAERRAIALASDNTDAKHVASRIIDDIGFDPVDLGPLANGQRFQPDAPLFNARLNVHEMRKLIHQQQ